MKILQILFMSAMMFIAVLVALSIAISLYPFKEYDIKTQPYKILTEQVKAGGTLQIEVDYCKLSNASGDITQIWEGPTRKIVPLGTFQAKKGCVKTILASTVPLDLSAGKYTLHGHGEYPKWLVGKAKVDTYTEEFEVIQ